MNKLLKIGINASEMYAFFGLLLLTGRFRKSGESVHDICGSHKIDHFGDLFIKQLCQETDFWIFFFF